MLFAVADASFHLIPCFFDPRNLAQKKTGLGSGSKYYKGTTRNNEGLNVGLESKDSKVRYRYDIDQKGFHINIEDFSAGKGDKAIKQRIDMKGGFDAYIAKIKELNPGADLSKIPNPTNK